MRNPNPGHSDSKAGKQYISEEKYKKLSDEEAEVLDYPEGSLYRARTVGGGRTVSVGCVQFFASVAF